MKWIFDWKCSLYSLTVCLDSMSPVLLFNFFFFFLLFCHILQQWYFLYLRITGQNTKQNKPIRIPLQLGSLEWNRTKLAEQNTIFAVGSRCFRQGFHLDYNGGGNNIAPFFSLYFFSQRPHFYSSISFVLMLVLHLRDTTAFLWWPKDSSCFTTIVTLSVGKYGFRVLERCFGLKHCLMSAQLCNPRQENGSSSTHHANP